jgi:hypothetical protein
VDGWWTPQQQNDVTTDKNNPGQAREAVGTKPHKKKESAEDE